MKKSILATTKYWQKIFFSLLVLSLAGCSNEDNHSLPKSISKKESTVTINRALYTELYHTESTTYNRKNEIKKLLSIDGINKDTKRKQVLRKVLNIPDQFVWCQGCHGFYGEKKALGKSKKINTMSSVEIINAIDGYRNGTYGGSLKNLMKKEHTSLNEQDIENIAEAIGKK